MFQGTPLEESASQLRDEGSSPGWGAKTHTPQLERARATKRPHSSTEGPAHGSRDLTQTKNTHTHTYDGTTHRAELLSVLTNVLFATTWLSSGSEFFAYTEMVTSPPV